MHISPHSTLEMTLMDILLVSCKCGETGKHNELDSKEEWRGIAVSLNRSLGAVIPAVIKQASRALCFS